MSEVQDIEETKTIDDFNEGKATLSELSEELQEKILSGNLEDTSTETEQKEEKSDDTPPKEEDEEDEVKKLKRLLYERSNELNHEKQLKQSHEQKMASDSAYREKWFKEHNVELKAESNEDFDPYDENNLGKLKEIDSLKEKIEQMQSTFDNMTKKEQELEAENKVYSEIEKVQNEVPYLKTSKNIKTLDSIFSKVYQATNGNVTESDMSAYGVSKEDFEKLQTVLNINAKKQSESYPTFRSAFRDSEYFDKLNNDTLVSQKRNEVLGKKYEEVSKQAQTLSSTNGEQISGTGWTKEALADYFRKNPDPADFRGNDKKMAEYKSAMEALGIV